MNANDLKKYVDFDRCYDFYTAREVTQFLKRYVPSANVTVVGRLLNRFARDKYFSKQGVKYLVRLKGD